MKRRGFLGSILAGCAAFAAPAIAKAKSLSGHARWYQEHINEDRDIIGTALDMSERRVSVYRNGVFECQYFTSE